MKIRVLFEGKEIQSAAMGQGKDRILIGRADHCDFRLEDRAIGREHVVLTLGSGAVSARKLSKFGQLFLNGAEIEEAVLKPGDALSLANYRIQFDSAETGFVESAPPSSASSRVTASPILASPLETDGTLPTAAAATIIETKMDPANENDFMPLGDPAPVASAGVEPAAPVLESASLDSPIDPLNGLGGSSADIVLGGGEGVENVSIDSNANTPTPPIEQGTPNAAEVDLGGEDRTAILSQTALDAKLVFKSGDANVEELEIKKAEVTIGRGTTCDVVIKDKKASRKHLVIKRVGAAFYAKDQGTGNGTSFNGEKLPEKELEAGDVIRIGDTEFGFQAVSKEYEQKQSDFLQVESVQEASSPPGQDLNSPISLNGDMNAGLGFEMQPNMEGAPGAPVQDFQNPSAGMPAPMPAGLENQNLNPNSNSNSMSSVSGQPTNPSFIPGLNGGASNKKETLVEKFKRQPPLRKLVIVCGALLLLILLADQEEPAKKGKTAAKGAAGRSTASTEAATSDARVKQDYANLSPEKQQFVVNTYQLALDLFKKQEYDRSLYEISKLFQVLPNGYKDAKQLKEYAEKAIEQIKAANEEKRRREDEEKIRGEIAAFLTQAQEALEKGKEKEAREALSQILERDPENAAALRINQILEDRDRKKKSDAESEREREIKRAQLEQFVEDGKKLLKAGRYYEVMEKMVEAPGIGSNDAKLLAKAKSLIQEAKQTLKKKTQPHLDEGDSAFNASDYPKARDAYQRAIKVDERNKHSKERLGKIRTILHDRSKKIYIEATIAEGLSDFKLARAKYKLCLDQSMQGDIYHGRCTRKFQRFDFVERAPAGGGQAAEVSPAGPASGGAIDPAKPTLPPEVQ